MSVLGRIAHFQNRRDEVANQDLARDLAAKKDTAGIAEIAGYLDDKNQDIQSDCLKVLYEVGYLNPRLVAPYAGSFLMLLGSRHNRLVWQAMLAVSTVVDQRADEIYAQRGAITQAMETGSVITIDNGVKTLALLAAGDAARRRALLPYLLRHLATCRPKDVPQHSEKTLVAITPATQADLVKVIEKRMPELSKAQAGRVRKVIKAASQL